MKKVAIAFSGFLTFLSAASVVEGATWYVKVGATGNCSSWTNACPLAQAVGAAAEGDSIWVKTGTYPPIVLRDGVNVKIIGGFAGTETAASQSNPATNPTTLDGS